MEVFDKIRLGHEYLFFDNDGYSYVEAVAEEEWKDRGYESKEECMDALYKDYFFWEDFYDYQYEDFENCLKDIGLLEEPEDYLIFGSDMGWRRRSGYEFVREADCARDIIDALHGDYDYTAKVTWIGGAHCLEAAVYHHDAPTGEHYYIVPCAWAEYAAAEDEYLADAIEQAAADDDEIREAIENSAQTERVACC